MVRNGRREYILEISNQACKRLHETGRITIDDAIIDKISKNTTNMWSVMLAGMVTEGGKCTESQYSDDYGSWDGVSAQASVKISLKEFEVPVKRLSGHVVLPFGTNCKLNSGYCLDSEGAENF